MNLILILFIFLPNISLLGVNLPTDNQVFFLIPFLLLLITKKIDFKIFPKFIFVPLILMIIGFSLGNLFIDSYYLTLKYNLSSLISYSIIPVLFGIGIHFSKKPEFIYRSIQITIFILFIAAIIQKFIDPSLLDIFIARTGINYEEFDRGTRSLFSEPSFVPTYMLLYLIIFSFLKIFVLNKKLNSFFYLTILMSIILAIASSAGQILICILLMFLALLISLICLTFIKIYTFITLNELKIRKKDFFVLLGISSIISYLIRFANSLNIAGSRFFKLLSLSLNNITLLFADQSLAFRLHAIYMPFVTPIICTFNIIPNKSAYIVLSRVNGYSIESVNNLYEAYSQWFANLTGYGSRIILPTKTYSIVGNISYDFALPGLLFIIFFLYIISKSIFIIIDNKKISSNEYSFHKLFWVSSIIMFSFINLSILCPPYWFITGLIYGLGKEKSNLYLKT